MCHGNNDNYRLVGVAASTLPARVVENTKITRRRSASLHIYIGMYVYIYIYLSLFIFLLASRFSNCGTIYIYICYMLDQRLLSSFIVSRNIFPLLRYIF